MGTPRRSQQDCSELKPCDPGLTNTEVADTKTRNKTTHHHVYPGLHRGDLNDVANYEQ
jgi:hypothetical protein